MCLCSFQFFFTVLCIFILYVCILYRRWRKIFLQKGKVDNINQSRVTNINVSRTSILRGVWKNHHVFYRDYEGFVILWLLSSSMTKDVNKLGRKEFLLVHYTVCVTHKRIDFHYSIEFHKPSFEWFATT